jgi:hypothetical protein
VEGVERVWRNFQIASPISITASSSMPYFGNVGHCPTQNIKIKCHVKAHCPTQNIKIKCHVKAYTVVLIFFK